MRLLRRCGLVGLVGGLVGVVGAAGAAQPPSRLVGARLTLNGIAGVVPGMTPSQVEQAWRIQIVLSGGTSVPGCRMARIAAGPVRGYALFEDGRLGAVFFTAGVRTDRGIGIGSTVETLTRAYGAKRLIFFPARNSDGIHVYTGARYLGDARALRFDPDPSTDRLTQIGLGGLNRALSIGSGRC